MYNAYASFEFILILLAMSYSLRVTSYNCRNYDEFMGYLGMVHSIIQESDVSSVYVQSALLITRLVITRIRV